MATVRHILGISGGKDSAALAVYMKQRYPQLHLEYYNSDTGCELAETEQLVERLHAYLGGIHRLRAAQGSPEATPFEHFLRVYNGFLPSPQQRWCTLRMKLQEMERYVGDEPAISYVGIRGDEDREGYISTKPNIQAIFPFRRNIWSIDVVHKFIANNRMDDNEAIYASLCGGDFLERALAVLRRPLDKQWTLSRKCAALLDIDIKLFNRAVFLFLKTTDLPVGQLEQFPLVDNDEVIVRADVFRLLQDSGIGIPAYYTPIPFEVDGQKGTYNRSRSGCYFCFFQKKIEWLWLHDLHPDLYQRAALFEKNGYTWNQGESLAQLAEPDRAKQIKRDAIRKQQEENKACRVRLVDTLTADDDNDAFCANCFI